MSLSRELLWQNAGQRGTAGTPLQPLLGLLFEQAESALSPVSAHKHVN